MQVRAVVDHELKARSDLFKAVLILRAGVEHGLVGHGLAGLDGAELHERADGVEVLGDLTGIVLALLTVGGNPSAQPLLVNFSKEALLSAMSPNSSFWNFSSSE